MPDPRFTARFPARERMLGYWVKLDSPVSTERHPRAGYDYSALDAQHGLLSYAGVLAGLTAINAGRQSGGHGAGRGHRPHVHRKGARREGGRGHRPARGRRDAGRCGDVPAGRAPLLWTHALRSTGRPDAGGLRRHASETASMPTSSRARLKVDGVLDARPQAVEEFLGRQHRRVPVLLAVGSVDVRRSSVRRCSTC